MADHYVYVLECADGSLYTGYTTDPERRVAEHDAGEGAKYTRPRTPVELVHLEAFESRSAALSREHEIKSLTRGEKERLVGERSSDDHPTDDHPMADHPRDDPPRSERPVDEGPVDEGPTGELPLDHDVADGGETEGKGSPR